MEVHLFCLRGHMEVKMLKIPRFVCFCLNYVN